MADTLSSPRQTHQMSKSSIISTTTTTTTIATTITTTTKTRCPNCPARCGLTTRTRSRRRTLPGLSLMVMVVLVVAAFPPTVIAQQRLSACQATSAYGNPTCTCWMSNTGKNVECPSRTPKLTAVPLAPEETVVINLSSNNITRIRKGDFIKLENIRTIFLQSNAIQTIENGAFDTLYNLKILVLSGNRLSMVPSTWFNHLSSLHTLDLSNNQIQSVDRRAFFTLPGSSASGVGINLSGNQIRCGCNARALRDWRLSLSNRVTPVQFTGFQCANANGQELDRLADNLFDCNSDVPDIFHPGTQECFTCATVNTQNSCDQQQNSCGTSQPVCQSRVYVRGGKLKVRKTCGDYTDCLLRSANNKHLCNATHAHDLVNDIDCFFCCSDRACNGGDMGGRTRSFELYVGVRLGEVFQDDLQDMQNSRTAQRAADFTMQLNAIVNEVYGGYEATFLNFRDDAGQVYVTSRVQVTVLNTVSVRDAGERLTNALNTSATQGGFLDEQRANLLYVGTELPQIPHLKMCPQEVTQTEVGALTWPDSPLGVTVVELCPGTLPSQNKRVRRQCFRSGQWGDPDISDCQKSGVTDRLTELNSTEITPNNVNQVLTQLNQLTSDGPSLTSADVTLAVDMVERSLTQGGSLQSGGSSLDNGLKVVSNVLEAQEGVLVTADRQSQSAARLLALTDRIGAEGVTGSDGQLLVTSPNVAVGALEVQDPANFLGATLTTSASSGDRFGPGDVDIEAQSSIPSADVTSLVLPPSLLTKAAASRIALKALSTDKLFQVIKQSRSSTAQVSDPAVNDDQEVKVRGPQVNSHVLDATVVGRDVTNLPDPVTATFVHLIDNATNPVCVFWDVGRSEWSSEGCQLDTALSTNTTSTCRCDHLTNFALLMDVYGEGSSLSEANKRALSIISYVGCGLSLLGLLLTLITYILFKKLRRDNPSKILVNLCIALFLSNLVFVAGMQPYALDNIVGCKIVGVLLHFSLLSALTWMAVEAFYMYLALVLVFKTYFTNFLLKCSLVGWGIPLVTVVITLAVNETDNYGPLDSGVCWLKGLAFYVAFLAPVGLILIINFVAFGLVLRQILGLSQRKLNKSDSFSTAQQLRGAVGVAILLGLTWIFALFAIDRASVVFYYLFAIFNSLQGLWIFVFYCLLKKEARNSWRRALPCWTTSDATSTMSNTRAGYSASNTRTERGKTSTTDSGIASSNTAFASSTTDSEGTYENITTKSGDNSNSTSPANKEKPVSAVAPIRTHEVHIKLTDHTYNNAHTTTTKDNNGQTPTYSPSPKKPAVVDSAESDDHVIRLVVSKGKYVPPSSPSQSSTSTSPQTPKSSKGGVQASSGGEGSEASPRALHFKVGYTLSNSSTASDSQDIEDDPNANAGAGNTSPSVADIIKRMNSSSNNTNL